MRRFPRHLLTALCAGLLTAGLAAALMINSGPAFAAPPEGKGGGGGGGGGDGGDDSTATVIYHLTFLGTPPGISAPQVSDVNNYGDIVGWGTDPTSELGPSYYRAFLYTADNGFLDLNALPAMADWPGWTAASADSINDSGQISVLMIDADGTKAVFLYDPLGESLTKIDEVGNLFVDSSNYSFLNAHGDIAYNKFDTAGISEWHFYKDGATVNLGIGGSPSGINAAGDIVGGVWEGWVVRYSTATGELLSLVDGRDPLAAKINDAGDFCLNVESNGGKRKPARYVEASGAVETVSDRGRVQDINSVADVLFADEGALFVATLDAGTVSVDARLTGSEEDLAVWNAKSSPGGVRMTDPEPATGFGAIAGAAIFSDAADREVYLITPVAPNP